MQGTVTHDQSQSKYTLCPIDFYRHDCDLACFARHSETQSLTSVRLHSHMLLKDLYFHYCGATHILAVYRKYNLKVNLTNIKCRVYRC